MKRLNRRRFYIRKRISVLVVLLLLLSSTAGVFADDTGQVRAGFAPQEVIGGFEDSKESWILNLGPEFPGAQGGFERVSTDAVSGSYAARLWGDFNNGGAYVSIRRPFDPIDMIKLSFWVKTEDLRAVRLRVVDATGQVHQQRLPLQTSGSWEQLSVSTFNGGEGYSHYGGANDGVWHAPATEVALILDRGDLAEGKLNGQMLIDDVIADVPMPNLMIRQTQLGNVFIQGELPTFELITSGDALNWTVQDVWGNSIAQGKEAAAEGVAQLTVPINTNGYYSLQVSAEREGHLFATQETSFAVLAPFEAGQMTDSPFGVATHFGQSWNPELIPLIAKMGASHIRDELYWNAVEHTKGQYDFPPAYDHYMQVLEQSGIKPFIIFSYINPNYDNGSTPYTDEGREGFANYGNALLQRYGHQMEWVEVYNEFNIGFGDHGDGPADSRPDYYYELLKATYEKVKAQNPDVTVVGPTTAGVPLDWMEELFKLGGLQYMDAVSIHPYRYPATPEGLVNDLIRVQDLIKRYNDGQPKPIWITEMGWPTQLDHRGVDEKTQASYLVRSHVLALSQGVEKFQWYDFMNDGTDPLYNEHNFGIIRNPADQQGKNVPKPAYVAYAAMTRALTGAQFKQQEQVGDAIHSYVFEKDRTDVRAIWSASGTKQITVKSAKPVVVTDLVGNAKTYSPDRANLIALTITDTPIYVQGNLIDVQEGSKYSLVSGDAFVNGDISLTLNVDNTAPPRAPIDAELEIGGMSFPISAGPGEQVEIPIVIPGQGAGGSKQWIGDIVVGGHPVGRLVTSVEVKQPLTLGAKHVWKDGQDSLQIRIGNRSSAEQSVQTLTWSIGGLSGTETLQQPISGHSEVVLELPLHEFAPGTYPIALTLYAADGEPIQHSGKLVMVEEGSYTPLAKKAIAVDGVLDDLSAIQDIDWGSEGRVQMADYNGPEDLSGTAWWTWDDDHLYLSAKVHDDVFSQTSIGDQIWNGDSIQFAVSAGTPGESGEWYEYGIALTPEGPQVYRWMTAAGKAPGPVAGANLKVTRDETSKDTIYELALPWDELAPIVPSDGILSISFLVNDNDGQGRKGWIEWGSGIGFEKSSALFKPARLME